MMPLADEGLILQASPYAESDKLISWYGAQGGRVTAIAKGAQKSKKRFCNKLEPFTRLQFFYRPPRSASGLYFLEDAQLMSAHIPLRQEYERFLAATCLAELTLRFTRELDADLRLYELLCWALGAVSREEQFFRYPLFFHLKLLQLTGYAPELGFCRRCGRAIEGGAVLDLSGQGAGGALFACASCRPEVALLRGISLQSIQIMRHVQHASLASLPKLYTSPRGAGEGESLLLRYSQYLLQTDLPGTRLFCAHLLRQEALRPPGRAFVLDSQKKAL